MQIKSRNMYPSATSNSILNGDLTNSVKLSYLNARHSISFKLPYFSYLFVVQYCRAVKMALLWSWIWLSSCWRKIYPCMVKHDCSNRVVFHAEHSGEIASLNTRIVKFSDSTNFIGGKLYLAVCFSAGRFVSKHIKGVSRIFAFRNPLQIRIEVSKFVSVFVIGKKFTWNWRNKSQRNKPVDCEGFPLVVFPKSNTPVTVTPQTTSNKTNGFASYGYFSSNSTKVGNGIKTFVILNLLPDLQRWINWFGHKLTFLKLIVLASLDPDRSSEVNKIYSSFLKMERVK